MFRPSPDDPRETPRGNVPETGPRPECIRSLSVQSDMAWAVLSLDCGCVLVGYHPNRPPSESSWSGWLSINKRLIEDYQLARVVVFTEGGAPSKAQQAMLQRTIYPEWSTRNIQARVGVQIITANPIFGSLVSATVAVLRIGARTLGLHRIIEFFGYIEGALEFANVPRTDWNALKEVRNYLGVRLL